MKKLFILLLVILLSIPFSAGSEIAEEWQTAPVIMQAYEISSGKLYLEWTGNAPVYQVYMDGQSVESVIVNNAVVPVEKGTHTILVYPINEMKNADTKIELGLDAKIIGGSIGLDLAALGLDAKHLAAGNPSAPLNIDYNPSTIFDAAPEKLEATTDPQDRVLLSFTDRYHADEYVVSVKIGKDVNYAKFSKNNEEAAALIQQNKTVVTLTLDPAFLEKQECMVPELDVKYSFAVQLRKNAENMLTGERVETVVHQSKESGGYQYTPTAAWKTAPVITYASQTADGQITIQWEHEDYSLGCEYAVLKINKALGIKTGEEELGVTSERNFLINDLMNGNYSFAIVPCLGGEKGNASAEVSVNIQNDWVVAPILTCESDGDRGVRLAWTVTEGVESYHITVHKGDSESLLRFIDMDYSKYAEYDIPAAVGEMEYIFQYENEINPETGEKFKFEVYGVRRTKDGEEQKTAVSSQRLTIGLGESITE